MLSYTNNSANKTQGMEINVIYLIRTLIKRWWVIALLMVVFASGGYLLSYLTYTPTYTSVVSFIASNRPDVGKGETGGKTSGDISASTALANNFKYVLLSNTLLNEVAADCDFDIAPGKIKNATTIKAITDTMIIELYVKTGDPKMSYRIAQEFVNNYKPIVEAKISDSSLNVVDAATYPEKPDSDSSSVTYSTAGAIVGLVFAFAIILISNALKDTVRNIEDIQDKLDLTVIGTVTHIPIKKKEMNNKKLLITNKASGFNFIETYKAIRTKIEASATRNGYKTFIITSAVENEGKTTVSTNIAISLAQNGKSVLLIDADLRKPDLHNLLEIPDVEDMGLGGVIEGKLTIKEAIKYVEKYKLFMLVGSHRIAEPTEILSSPQMENIIKAAEQEFDYIIIDTTPVSVVTDAVIIAQYADAAVMVIRDDKAHMYQIKTALDDLSSSGINIIGCVYNNVESSGVGGRYGYGRYGQYGGYYGYGYGHNSPSKENK